MNSVAPLHRYESTSPPSVRHDSLQIAAACREAALTFINDAPRWGKRELASWLVGPYTRLVGHGPLLALATPPDPALTTNIDPRMLTRVLTTARTEVIETLARARDPEAAASWAFASFSAQFVMRRTDVHGAAVWMPTARATRLADRVLSLLVADYLARPFDYESGLSFCTCCERVQIGSSCGAENCGRSVRTSIVAPRVRTATLPYLPEGA
jgi:hypothetical protein